jgi:trimeric autotransporter adhesin
MLITEIRFLRVKCQPSLSSYKAGTISRLDIFGRSAMRTITTRTCGLLCICALLLAVTSAVANAQTRIGAANSVQPEASGSVAGTLSAGSGVHANETVRTGGSGRAGLQFNDQSNLSVGPSSQVRLDKFVYDPNKGTGSTVIEATRGTFRFTTGSQNKGEVKIKTPYGTLGTRG